jgi:RimJ/RimL family protein N-acetyltransferase
MRGTSEKADDLSVNIVLRDVVEADLLVFYEQQLDPEAVRMAAFPSRAQPAFMEHWTRIMSDSTNILQTILYRGEIAGNIVSWNQDGRRQVGYWLGRKFWGKGVATMALSNLLEHILVRPLYAHVARHNIASRRVLEKCGFRVIGADRALSEPPAEPVEELILRLDSEDSGNA